jgi:hypothetical protein
MDLMRFEKNGMVFSKNDGTQSIPVRSMDFKVLKISAFDALSIACVWVA